MSRFRLAVPPTLLYPVRLVVLAVGYYGAARLGLQYASIGHSISLVWPPTGIAFAALTLLGYRYWPGVALGAFFANAATPVPLLAAAGIAVGNTLEALVAAYLLRRTTGPGPRLDDLKQIRTLVLAAAPLGALCSALIGTLSLLLAGVLLLPALPRAAAIWWTGDVLGALVVAPVFFTWSASPQARDSARRLIEVVGLCAGTVIAAEMGLGRLFQSGLLHNVEYPYLLFPFVVWAALRFGARGASLMTLTVAAAAVRHAITGGGPFIGRSVVGTLFQVAVYLAVVAVTGLVLAAAVRWERYQATRALADSEERLRRALNAARMGIWYWSVEPNRLTWDDNLRRLYGLGPQDRVSTHEEFLERVHPDDRQSTAEEIRRVLHSGEELDHEFRIVLPDGSVRWVADQGEVRRDDSGRPVYLVGVGADVTERRLAEERLRQSHRMESVGRLAGGVAHETNNQMSVVLGAADFILQRSDVPDPVRQDVEFIRKAAERTATVTSQLLAFSRRQILRPEMLDLSALVKGWEPILRRVMGEDSTVRLNLSVEPGLVRADPGQFEQVLLNLALNARDAMPEGGTIAIETFRAQLGAPYAQRKAGTSVRSGEYSVLAVSDTGNGMDQETLTHIFEPFFTTKGIGRGTGLGLATVYGIVKQSEGYVWVYSEPGKGTTFKIYLPIRTGTAKAAVEPPPPPRSKAGEKVLLVEDETQVRAIMKRSLESAGYEVLETASATDALELARTAGPIHLVLSDVVMPGMNGRELAARLGELMPQVPVLFTSGYTDGEIERRGLLRPGSAFVQKPVTPDALVQAVRDLLEATANRPRSDSGGGAV